MELVYPLEAVEEFVKRINFHGDVVGYYNSIPVPRNSTYKEQIAARCCMTLLALIRAGHNLDRKVTDRKLTNGDPEELTMKKMVVKYVIKSFTKNGPGFHLNLELVAATLEKLSTQKHSWQFYIIAGSGWVVKNERMWNRFIEAVDGVWVKERVTVPEDAVWGEPRELQGYTIYTGYPISVVEGGIFEDSSLTLRCFEGTTFVDREIKVATSSLSSFENYAPDLRVDGPIRGNRVTVICEDTNSYLSSFPGSMDRLTGPEFEDIVPDDAVQSYEFDGFDFGAAFFEKKSTRFYKMGVAYWGGMTDTSNTHGGISLPQIFIYIKVKKDFINLNGLEDCFGQKYKGEFATEKEYAYWVSQIPKATERIKKITKKEVSLKHLMSYLEDTMRHYRLTRYFKSLATRLPKLAEGASIRLWKAVWVVASEQRGALPSDRQKLAQIAGEAAFRHW